ncbi:hypothetical protein EYF80_016400 [Liparis tanakae]|uniref:Uncharacterized protein n=1 Tax=Liparis tanakae TaxID=230148 RepID=A0A4Z2I5Y1_9TELE|nr:hypothetical protein EYF80_016400 [Liparis tanakae]
MHTQECLCAGKYVSVIPGRHWSKLFWKTLSDGTGCDRLSRPALCTPHRLQPLEKKTPLHHGSWQPSVFQTLSVYQEGLLAFQPAGSLWTGGDSRKQRSPGEPEIFPSHRINFASHNDHLDISARQREKAYI